MANVLGINLSVFPAEKIKGLFVDWLIGSNQRLIVTPNPEIILAAHHDEELFFILNRADLAPVDGFGLQVAAWIYGEKAPRVTGADMVKDLLVLAASKKIRIAILNWRGGLSRRSDIESALKKHYPGLESIIIDASRSHSVPDIEGGTIAKLTEFEPAILFCTFGAPYQEKVLYHNLNRLPSVRIAIGCGGAFDFLTGKLKRAPKLFRAIGLEWVWRLIKQPARLPRIFNAVFVFIGKVLQAKFITRYRYRPNVACLLYKRQDGRKQILVVERAEEKGHWQLPQGGTDGETIEVAGARELREETGAASVETRAVFKNLYTYDFPGARPASKAESRLHKYDYKGQKQSLYIAEYLGDSKELKINFWDHSDWKWVDSDRLVDELHPIRRTAAQIYLEKFKSLNL